MPYVYTPQMRRADRKLKRIAERIIDAAALERILAADVTLQGDPARLAAVRAQIQRLVPRLKGQEEPHA